MLRTVYIGLFPYRAHTKCKYTIIYTCYTIRPMHVYINLLMYMYTHGKSIMYARFDLLGVACCVVVARVCFSYVVCCASSWCVGTPGARDKCRVLAGLWKIECDTPCDMLCAMSWAKILY